MGGVLIKKEKSERCLSQRARWLQVEPTRKLGGGGVSSFNKYKVKRLERDFPGKQNALISRNGTCQVEILFLYAEHVEVRAKSGCVVENS